MCIRDRYLVVRCATLVWNFKKRLIWIHCYTSIYLWMFTQIAFSISMLRRVLLSLRKTYKWAYGISSGWNFFSSLYPTLIIKATLYNTTTTSHRKYGWYFYQNLCSIFFQAPIILKQLITQDKTKQLQQQQQMTIRITIRIWLSCYGTK